MTVAVSFGKYCGTSLNTAPLPKPKAAAAPRAPTVNVGIEGQPINTPSTATANCSRKPYARIMMSSILNFVGARTA